AKLTAPPPLGGVDFHSWRPGGLGRTTRCQWATFVVSYSDCSILLQRETLKDNNSALSVLSWRSGAVAKMAVVGAERGGWSVVRGASKDASLARQGRRPGAPAAAAWRASGGRLARPRRPIWRAHVGPTTASRSINVTALHGTHDTSMAP